MARLEKELGVAHDALADIGVGVPPGSVQPVELAYARRIPCQRGHQALTLLGVGPGQRDQ